MAIEQRKNKDGTLSFRARVQDPAGKWYPSEWKRLRDMAMAQEAVHTARKRKGEPALTTDEPEGKRYTVSNFWEVYQVENRHAVSDGWKISQDQMWDDYVTPVIGKKRLAEVGIPDIGRVLNRMKEMGRGEQMRLHVYRLLYQVFDSAVNYYSMISKSPVSAEYHRIKVPESEAKFLRPEQSWHLLEEAKRSNDRAVWLELLAGLRIEAVVGLIWPNVHWDANQILICQTWKSKVKRLEPFPKGKKAEYVPLTPVLKEYLWECYQGDRDKTGFVCQGPRGGMLSTNTYYKRLMRLCRRAGVPAISSHALRHSCTEIFVREGASQEDLRRLLNHRDGKTTLRYMHRTDDRLSAIAARIQKPQLTVIPGGAKPVTHGITHAGNFERMPLKESVGK